jgi:hypothetical protein
MAAGGRMIEWHLADGMVQIFWADTHEPLARIPWAGRNPGDIARGVRIGGNRVLVGFHVFDAGSGNEIPLGIPPDSDPRLVGDIEPMSDGRWVTVAESTTQTMVVNPFDGAVIYTLPAGRFQAPWLVRYVASGEVPSLFLGCDPPSVQRWFLDDDRMAQIAPAGAYQSTLWLGADGERIAHRTGESTLDVYDTRRGERVATVTTPLDDVDIAFRSGNREAIVAGASGFKRFDLATGAATTVRYSPRGDRSECHFASDTARIACINGTRFELLDGVTGRRIRLQDLGLPPPPPPTRAQRLGMGTLGHGATTAYARDLHVFGRLAVVDIAAPSGHSDVASGPTIIAQRIFLLENGDAYVGRPGLIAQSASADGRTLLTSHALVDTSGPMMSEPVSVRYPTERAELLTSSVTWVDPWPPSPAGVSEIHAGPDPQPIASVYVLPNGAGGIVIDRAGHAEFFGEHARDATECRIGEWVFALDVCGEQLVDRGLLRRILAR